MADTLTNTALPAGTWVDLYAATGIVGGVQILVQNIGVCDVYLSSQTLQPTDETARQLISRSQFVINDPGDSGAWAYCANDGGLVNVRIAP